MSSGMFNRSKGSEQYHSRAIEDFSQFSQSLRMCGQIIFAANGAASLSMLAALTNLIVANAAHPITDLEIIQKYCAVSAAFYLFGVTLAIMALLFTSLAKLYWGSVWEMRAMTPDVQRERRTGKRARRLERAALLLICCAIFDFFIGSTVAIAGLIW
ncbi:hypothetical protein LWE61_10115 [Sphingobium sufflavum]|uniref:hypothetical protein n=1 Tax=Sphingobium sufflavum TaxID=1129547 RepID=UPI001F21C591|nr:hypothetical protein [Sphingobium sufflavum]MCE7796913.1 hypothetical protein [Sphingobium sufflavum]